MAKAKNQKEFEELIIKHIKARISKAVEKTAKEVYKVIDRYIKDYYKEQVFGSDENGNPISSIPEYYDRTYKFLNSLVSSNVINVNNKITVKVGLSDDYLGYEYPGYTGDDETFKRSNVRATGLDVATWANTELHGGSVKGGIRFWDDAIDELGGMQGIKKKLIENIRACGINIKT
jgi:hypothetical protein